jgi:hypothetical protein
MDKFHAPERTFTRNRGCYSCKSFANEELVRQHWATKRPSLLTKTLTTPLPASMAAETPSLAKDDDPRLKQLKDMDRMVATGCVGICMKGSRPKEMGGPEGEFVAYAFLCDRWDGRDGHSLATAGKPVDKLNEELQIIALERVKK